MEGQLKSIAAWAALFALGCARPNEAPFPNWLTDEGGAASLSPADQALLNAALFAESRAPEDALRVSFTPGRAERLIKTVGGAADMAARAAANGGLPRERFGPPFQALPGQAGWRLIGRVLVWRIERAAAEGNGPAAVNAYLAASRLGRSLSAGCATDASLGYAILKEAADAIAPALEAMEPAALRALGTGSEAVLAGWPSFRLMLENEAQAMRHAVQYVQDAYRDRQLGGLRENLGKDIEPALEALDRLRGEESSKRADYFSRFNAEADFWIERFALEFGRNARQRAALPKFELKGDRPWRRFARHFFAAAEPLPTIRDQAIVRLRLIGLEALLRAECRVNGRAPSTLAGISKHLITDPYSGVALVYRPDQANFRLYSVGPDFRDDGGEPGSDLALR